MYLDQVNNVLDYDMWINLKNEYEVKLNRLSAEYPKQHYANTNFLDTELKILDLCRKASFPATELSAEEVANIIRETYLSATANSKNHTNLGIDLNRDYKFFYSHFLHLLYFVA